MEIIKNITSKTKSSKTVTKTFYSLVGYLHGMQGVRGSNLLGSIEYFIAKKISALFAMAAFVLIIVAIVENNLFGLHQLNVNFG